MRRGWTQKELARRVGFKERSKVSQLERARLRKWPLAPEELINLASELDLSILDLLEVEYGINVPALAPQTPEQTQVLQAMELLPRDLQKEVVGYVRTLVTLHARSA